MTKAQAKAYVRFLRACEAIGITEEEADNLLKIERALSRWSLDECNGYIERDEAGKTWRNHMWGRPLRCPTMDMETGALRRARAIASAHGLEVYHQGDPRGCSLYLVKPGESDYARWLACCID